MKKKQIIEKIGKRLAQLKKSQHMKNTKMRLQQIYNRFKARKTKRQTIPFIIRQRQIHISWKWGLFGIVAYAAYLQLQKKKDPVEQLEHIYGKRVKRILVVNQQLWLNTEEIPEMHAQSTIIHVTPVNQEQLASIVGFCRSRNLHVVSGNFSIIPNKLSQLMPLESQKSLPLLIINIDQLQDVHLDKQFNQLTLQMGCKCNKVNKLLEQEGYQSIFMKQFDDLCVFKVIGQNLPLKIPFKPHIGQNMVNMQMVSTEGINYLSSSQGHLGPGLNMNSILLGSEGRYSIPAKITLKLTKKKQSRQTRYKLDPNSINSSQSASKILQLKSKLQQDFQGIQTLIQRKESTYNIAFNQYGKSQFQIKSSLQTINDSKLFSQLNQPQDLNQQESYLLISLNQRMLQALMVNQQFKNINFSCKNNLLRIGDKNNQEQIKKLCSFLILQGANIVWCRDQKLCKQIKKTNQGIQSGIQMMKKMKQIREALDPRRNLSCPDYERIYFKKSLFRRMTQFFW